MLQIKRSELKKLAQNKLGDDSIESQNKVLVMISTSLAARTSYTVVGHEKELNAHSLIDLHDRLLSQDPPHSSPLEHCARAMSDEEYVSFIKGVPDMIEYEKDEIAISYLKTYEDSPEAGWCYNLKGFISYRYLIDNKGNM